MTGEAWNRVRSRFGDLLELSHEERSEELEKLRLEDPAAASELSRLLKNYEEARSFLEQPVTPDWHQLLSTVAPKTLVEGTILANRYEIRDLLGAGGMGEVYAVWDREMRIPVALKLLPPQLAGSNAMVDRFLREVYLAREVTHPGICKTYDLGRGGEELDAHFFLTMELITGETLSSRLNRGAIAPVDGEAILIEIAEAIAAAHRLQVIHRDLKPSNVMVRTQPLATGHRVVIMDFGLAAGKVPATLEAKTAADHQIGTPQYMAPEQLANEPATEATDVYAFGLIAYEVLTGHRPLDQCPPLAALIKRAKNTPPDARTISSEIPPRWNTIISRCLEPDPLKRFLNAGILAEALHSSRPIRRNRVAQLRLSRRDLMILGVSAAIGSTWLAVKSRPKESRVPKGTGLLLTPVVNQTGEPELDGVRISFASEIQQSTHLRFSEPDDHPEELKMILKKHGEMLDSRAARHLALRAQIPLVLFASLGRVGSDYVFDVTLEHVEPSTELASATWPASFRAAGQQQIHTALFNASRWLRQITGESETSITDLGKRPEEVTTDSWEALREFSRATEQAETDLNGAVVTLDAALRRDPLFAMAHMRRGDYLIRLNRFSEGCESWRVALTALDKRPISRREELMIRSMYADDMQAFPQAAEYYKELMRVYPYVDYPWRYLSSPLMKMGYLEESIAIAKELIARTGGHRWTHWRKLLDYQAIAGHVKEAAETWDALKRHQPPRGESELASFMLFASSGKSADAEQSIKDALTKVDETAHSKYVTTYSHWLAGTGRLEEACQLLSDNMQVDQQAGRYAERARKLVSLAAIKGRIDERKGVRSACLEAVELDNGPQRVRRAAVVLARNGFAEDAMKVLPLLESAGKQPLGLVSRAVVESEIRLSKGDPKGALQVLQPVKKLRSHTDSRLEWARALTALSRTSEALLDLQDAIRYRNSEWVAADLALPMDYHDAEILLSRLQTENPH